MWRLGIDTGGTFTDVCLLDAESGQLFVHKVPSTPGDPSRAILFGITACLEALGLDSADIAFIGHGTTVATNALIEFRGARTGLITTRGFRDLLEIGRQRRPHLYDLQCDKPQPLVARDLRLEIGERMRHDGRVERALDPEEVRAAVRQLKAAGVEAIAVCLLYAFRFPRHEQMVATIIAEEFPGCFCTTSHEIAPEFREYERLSTAVVNSYVGPVMQRYLSGLKTDLRARGVAAPIYITQSNGGTIGIDAAARQPARTVLSGPAAGITAAIALGEAGGPDDFITFDMGGTSTDVALVRGLKAELARETATGGYPLRLPMLDIHAVGAGGGSIARVDAGGLLKVGPESAGADPGPMCYGLGGTRPTVTDANVVLGTLHPSSLLGGRMKIDRAAAEAGIALLARDLGLSVIETAQGIVSVAAATIARAVRTVSVERGHDPRAFGLMAFGGAGPLHAARLAVELGIRRIIVPRHPGALCALGLLFADLKHEVALHLGLDLDAAVRERLADAMAEVRRDAEAWLAAELPPNAARAVEISADMRYRGQNYELGVLIAQDLPPAELAQRLRQDFDRAHSQRYGHMAPDDAVEIVALRGLAIGRPRKYALVPTAPADGNASAARTGSRPVWFPEAGDFLDCPVHARDLLGVGHVVAGPAVIEQMDTTTVVLPGMRARVDAFLNLVLEAE